MIPQQVLSSSLFKAPFLYPDNVVRRTELEDFEMGGIGLQDPSQGLQYQAWQGEIDAATKVAKLFPVDNPAAFTNIFTETTTPVEFSFSFDLNMRYMAVVRFADNTVRMRWYDSAIPGYAITTYSNILSCMMAMDDKRAINSAAADVIFTYLKTDNKLYFREQRDRFLIEYPLTDVLATGLRITNFGMAKNGRVQWRLAVRRLL